MQTQSQAVDVRDLEKVFTRRKGLGRKRRTALNGVSFTMERGECVAILGQNGSGKSTLVRLLSTLLLPDGGEARVFGYDVFKEARAVRRLVNRVSVEASFFKKMSAAENLAYAARFYGMGPRETHAKIPVILERVGFPLGAARTSRWRTSRAACSRRSRSRAPCSPRRCCCCSTSRRPVSTRARSRRCRPSSARSGCGTTRRSCSARTT